MNAFEVHPTPAAGVAELRPDLAAAAEFAALLGALLPHPRPPCPEAVCGGEPVGDPDRADAAVHPEGPRAPVPDGGEVQAPEAQAGSDAGSWTLSSAVPSGPEATSPQGTHEVREAEGGQRRLWEVRTELPEAAAAVSVLHAWQTSPAGPAEGGVPTRTAQATSTARVAAERWAPPARAATPEGEASGPAAWPLSEAVQTVRAQAGHGGVADVQAAETRPNPERSTVDLSRTEKATRPAPQGGVPVAGQTALDRFNRAVAVGEGGRDRTFAPGGAASVGPQEPAPGPEAAAPDGPRLHAAVRLWPRSGDDGGGAAPQRDGGLGLVAAPADRELRSEAEFWMALQDAGQAPVGPAPRGEPAAGSAAGREEGPRRSDTQHAGARGQEGLPTEHPVPSHGWHAETPGHPDPAGGPEAAPRAHQTTPDRPEPAAPHRLRLELEDARGEPVRLEVRAASEAVWARLEGGPEVVRVVRDHAHTLHQALAERGLSLAGLEVDTFPHSRPDVPEPPAVVPAPGRSKAVRREVQVRAAAGSVDYVV